MAHLRKRYAEIRVRKLLGASPIVGLLGQRQVGKSTLVSELCREYLTFDRESVLLEANADPDLFVKERSIPCGIDEAQLCPRLFPSLKEHVRTSKRSGQFLLSGSVRFTSRKAIRESLTGRVLNVELLPFSIAESNGHPLERTIQKLTRLSPHQVNSFVQEKTRSSKSEFDRYLINGGLPGICFSRDASVRDDRWQTHLDTLLNRDYRLLHATTLPYGALRDALTHLAINQGKPLELKALSEASRISFVTVKKVLFTFESLFLIRSIPVWGGSKHTAYFLEDQGMSSWLANRPAQNVDPALRIAAGLYANLRHELFYQPQDRGSIATYRTRHGVLVHLVFQTVHGILGIIASPDSVPRPKTIAAAQAFLKKYPKARVVIAYSGSRCVIRSDQHFWIPYFWLI